MTVEMALLMSGVSLAFALYQGIVNLKRDQKTDNKNEATQLTTVIVKLENIGLGITEIKNEMNNVKNELITYRERLVKVEESNKSMDKRLSICELHCPRLTGNNAPQINKGSEE